MLGNTERELAMGWGDEIMVTGEAIRLGATPEKKLIVLGKDSKPRWHPVWQGNPRIAKPEELRNKTPYIVIRNHGGWRPYLSYSQEEYFAGIANSNTNPRYTTKERWVFTDWKVTKGELFFPKMKMSDYVVLEPNTKNNPFAINKRWPWDRWQRLSKLLKDHGIDVVQLGPEGTRLLDGARLMPTPNFIAAITALSGAGGAILPEGGLHHAAAALGVPAAVLFGGTTSPANTGYKHHLNIADEDEKSPCGARVSCPHCAEAWQRLEPESVFEQFIEWIEDNGK